MRGVCTAFLMLAFASCDADPGYGHDPGRADLPNSELHDREHDGAAYKRIAEYFENAGYSIDSELTELHLSWPVAGDERRLLNRFGTPVQLADWGYHHTAFDILGNDSEQSVIAPIDGEAMLFDWSGEPGYHGSDMVSGSYQPRGNYSTVIAIWDPLSQVVVQLMHVEPTAELKAADGFVAVSRGQLLGHFATIPLPGLSGELERNFRHTHLSLVDGGHMRIINPASATDYRDTIAPELAEIYLLDENAEKHNELRPGRFDLVVEVSDRDDDSERNFGIGAIAFALSDPEGATIASLEKCHLDHLYRDIAAPSESKAIQLIDFGNARHQLELSAWPRSDIGDANRRFRYALTQLRVDTDGQCRVLDDQDGFLQIDDAPDELRLEVRLWDHSGNRTESAHSLTKGSDKKE